MMKDQGHNNSFGGATESTLKMLIFRTLRKHIIDKHDEADKEQCMADAAEKIVETLRDELLFSSSIDKITDASDIAQSRSFNEIVGRALGDVRFSYLSSNLQMMMALGSAIAERDTGSSEHNYKVTLYSARLGEKIGLNREQIQSLVKGSFLHDIGKIGIPDRILMKTGKFSSFESITMQNHVLLGSRIIKDVKWLEDAQEIVLFHHERWDGSGYLAKLKGDSIPINARIFAIVDVFDALISDRPYKPAMSFDQAIRYLSRQTDVHFDPDLLGGFIEISKDAYNETAETDISELPSLVEKMIKEHFDIDLSDEKLRSKFHIM